MSRINVLHNTLYALSWLMTYVDSAGSRRSQWNSDRSVSLRILGDTHRYPCICHRPRPSSRSGHSYTLQHGIAVTHYNMASQLHTATWHCSYTLQHGITVTHCNMASQLHTATWHCSHQVIVYVNTLQKALGCYSLNPALNSSKIRERGKFLKVHVNVQCIIDSQNECKQ